MLINCYDLGMNGEGVGKLGEKVCFVDFLLPGERAEIEIKESHKNYATGSIAKILKEDNSRVKPRCKYFYTCGGCALQHMNYKRQLEFKSSLVKKTIKKIVGIDCEVGECVPCDSQFGYRNKLSFNFSDGVSGFYERFTHKIVQIDACPLASGDINKIFSLFVQFAQENDIKAYVKHLVVREINGQVLIGVVTSCHIELKSFYKILGDAFKSDKNKKFGLFEVLNTRKDQVVLTGNISFVCGISEIEICEFGIKYFVDLLSFHQTNIYIQNKIYREVLNRIEAEDVVVNGFSGAGLLSGILSKKARKVIGIEIDPHSHRAAERLKKDNNIKNLNNILGDFQKNIQKFKNYNTLVLDPSKKGCGKEILRLVTDVDKIIYISCNIIALAKDLNFLLDYYKIEEILPFDMFPNTSVVETMVVLKRLTK